MVFPSGRLSAISDEEVLELMSTASYEGDLPTVRTLLPRLRTFSTNITTDMQNLIELACGWPRIRIILFLLSKGAVLLPHIPIRVARRMRRPDYLAEEEESDSSDAENERDLSFALALFKAFVAHGWDVNTKVERYGNALT